MKQNFKHIILLPLFLFFLCFERAAAQTYVNVANTGNAGTASWGVGIAPNQFDVTGPYTATGTAVDHFYNATGSGTPIEISGNTAPSFGNLVFSNGATSTANITNTAGIIVNTSAAFNNGITSTIRTNRAAGVPAAIQFLGSAVYTPTLTPATGTDVTFVDGYVSKVNPSSFVFPVGNVTDLRPITATGTGTFTTSWNSSNVASFYTGALPSGVKSISTNGFWEWATSAPSTVTVSIPNEAAFVNAASNLTIVGYNGTAWTNLGGTFTTLTENSTNTTAVNVPANITAIAMGQAGVPLSLKVFLEGDMGAGATMRNDLQNYFGGNLGLLPSISPYGGVTNTYTLINNPLGPAGAVADWITVEVRVATGTANPYSSSVETQYLLLKTDGTIVTPTGAVPVFSAQSATVRVVIKHRNHLAIMSNDITNFNSAKTYDFSSGLAQALNDGGDPAQMKLNNGVWTMIGGDVFNDMTLDASDGPIFNAAFSGGIFDQYVVSDINMDGAVDGSDGSFVTMGFNAGYFSTGLNY